MISPYLLPVLLGVAAAYPSTGLTVLPPRQVSAPNGSSLANGAPLDRSAHTAYLCPAVPKGQTQAEVTGALDTHDLAVAMGNLECWAENSKTVNSSVGGEGGRFISNGVVAIFCNMGSQDLPINASLIDRMYHQIQCGDSKSGSISEGYGQVSIHNKKPDPYYLYFGPTSTAGKCMSQHDFDNLVNMKQTKKQPCANAIKYNDCTP